jgi:ABC-type glycerol-3-phosphate transport system permease component
MKARTTGTVSGCIVWIIVFGIVSLCIFPAAMIVGGITSASTFATQTLGPFICPDGTTAESYSYATTTTDEFGNSQPSTAYELHCVDANGAVVKEDPVVYAFLWMGIIVGICLIISSVLAFALAAPAGVLIGRLLNREKKQDIRATVEPE